MSYQDEPQSGGYVDYLLIFREVMIFIFGFLLGKYAV